MEKQNMPTVSICTLAFNHQAYIRECLDSILMQKTAFLFEILIHDDASTDGTVDIIKEYEEKYPDIIKPIYQKENQYSKGIGVTRTYQLPRAKGKYISFCEGDDFWMDEYKLQKQVDFLESNTEYSICGHNAIKYYQKNGSSDLFNQVRSKHTYNLEDMVIQDWFIPTASIVFRKSEIDKVTMSKTFYNSDYYIQLLLLSSGKTSLYYMNDVMSVYRVHEKSLSKQISAEIFYDHIISLLTYMDEYTNKKHSEAFLIKIQALENERLEYEKAIERNRRKEKWISKKINIVRRKTINLLNRIFDYIDDKLS